MTTSSTFVNYYDILEVAQTSSTDEIEKAIKQQRRVWAKRQSLPDQERRHQAERRMAEIADAERILLDPTRRASYDQELRAYRPPVTPSAAPSADGNWVERAREFLDRGDAHSAAYAAREATSQDGSNDLAWALRAEASLMLGRTNDCIFELNEALRLSPDNPGYHFDLGTVYEGEGRWADALSCYENAARLRPDVPAFRVAIASVFLQNDLPSKALPILEAAVAEEPENDHFKFYLAVALHDLAISEMTPLRNGTFVITSENAAYKVLELSERAERLRFSDQQLRDSLRKNISLANDALRTRFTNALAWSFELGLGGGLLIHAVGYYLVLLLPVMLLGANAALGILAAPPWYYGMYKLFFRPGWKINEKASRSLRLR